MIRNFKNSRNPAKAFLYAYGQAAAGLFADNWLLDAGHLCCLLPIVHKLLTPAGRYRNFVSSQGVCPSGQREQTVNLPAYAYGGSNPPAPSKSLKACNLSSLKLNVSSNPPEGSDIQKQTFIIPSSYYEHKPVGSFYFAALSNSSSAALVHRPVEILSVTVV